MTTQTSSFTAKALQSVSIVILIATLSTGCAESGQFPLQITNDTNQSAGVAIPDEDDATPTTPSPSPAEPGSSYQMQPLAWENATHPQRKQWSAFLQDIILNKWSSLLPGANDMTLFCPPYNRLANEERANVWAQLFVAMAKYESAYSPVSRMHETTMGNDPVTGQPVYSEGLLQLSYQDVQWAPWCEFDWSKDKSLSPTSPKKTILDPYLNLDCGVGIMAQQIKRKGSIILDSGVYWAVLKGNGKYQQISGIQSMVKSLSLCK